MRGLAIAFVALAGGCAWFEARDHGRLVAAAERGEHAAVRAEIEGRLADGSDEDESARLYEVRALVNSREKKYAEAIADATKSLELDPPRTTALVVRALARNMTGDHAGALADAERAAQLAPGYQTAHFQRAAALTRLGRRGDALAACDRAVAIEASAEAVTCRGDSLLVMGHSADAIVELEAAVARATSAHAYGNLAWARFRVGQLDAAVDAVDRALALDPGFGPAFGARCWVRFTKGEHRRARADCHRADVLAESALHRGLICWIDGDAAGAVAEWTVAVQQWPVHAKLLVNLLAQARAKSATP